VDAGQNRAAEAAAAPAEAMPSVPSLRLRGAGMGHHANEQSAGHSRRFN
jgi:hypothetical protein